MHNSTVQKSKNVKLLKIGASCFYTSFFNLGFLQCLHSPQTVELHASHYLHRIILFLDTLELDSIPLTVRKTVSHKLWVSPIPSVTPATGFNYSINNTSY